MSSPRLSSINGSWNIKCYVTCKVYIFQLIAHDGCGKFLVLTLSPTRLVLVWPKPFPFLLHFFVQLENYSKRWKIHSSNVLYAFAFVSVLIERELLVHCQVFDIFVRILGQLVCIVLYLVPKILMKNVSSIYRWTLHTERKCFALNTCFISIFKPILLSQSLQLLLAWPLYYKEQKS